MSAAAAITVDTLKLAEQLRDAGFTRKQAAGAAEILANLLASHPRREVVLEAIQTLARAVDQRFATVDLRLETLARSVDQRFDAVDQRLETLTRSVDQRFAAVDQRFDAVDQRFDSMQAEHRADMARIEALLGKLLDGQAVLFQNDMELKRRLDGIEAAYQGDKR